MYNAMGLAIATMTFWTAWIAMLFFRRKFPDLPKSYILGIRLGIVLFVVFAFEGFAMGANLSHPLEPPTEALAFQ